MIVFIQYVQYNPGNLSSEVEWKTVFKEYLRVVYDSFNFWVFERNLIVQCHDTVRFPDFY